MTGCVERLSTQYRFLDLASFSDLKRFSDSNTRASKLSTFVNFPLKELDLREFSSAGSGRCQRNIPSQLPFAGAPVFADGVCLCLQSAWCTTSTQCPTTQGTRWEAITRPSAGTRCWGSGTSTTTPGIVTWAHTAPAPNPRHPSPHLPFKMCYLCSDCALLH